MCDSVVYAALQWIPPPLPAAKAGDPAKIDSVTITPDPPQKGKSVTVKATVTVCMLNQSNT